MTQMNSQNELPDNNLVFAEDPACTAEPLNLSEEESTKPWKVMVIDDEPGVHDLTKIVLDDFSFMGRQLEIINGFSGKDARSLLREHTDTAVLLLDVVMETDREGLDVVNYTRKVLNNKLIRIILRTGQPGQSYEKEVVTAYEINDYQEKSLFTAQKFNTSMVIALRAYADLLAVQQQSHSNHGTNDLR